MNESDMSKYLGIFLDEAEEQLQQLDEAVVLLEQDPGNRELLNRIFRIAHTLKGSSASMGFEKMAALTHRMENVLDALRQGRLTVSRQVVDLLLACLDKLRELKEQQAGGTEEGVEVEGLLADLETLLEGETGRVVSESSESRVLELNEVERNVIREAKLRGYRAYEIYVELEPSCRMKGPRAFLVFNNLKDYGEIIKSEPHTQELEEEKFDLSFWLVIVSEEDADTLANVIKSISEIRNVEVNPVELNGEAFSSDNGQFSELRGVNEEGSNAMVTRGRVVESSRQSHVNDKHKAQTIRVDVRRLEKMINLVGELVIDHTRLRDIDSAFRSGLRDESLLQALEEMTVHTGRILSELQEEVLKTRMLPIDQVFSRFPRMVRDLANRAGKEINFIVEGRETELDRTVIEEISDPLIHLLRNAVDHGIEPPEERVRVGKPRRGTIILKAFHKENMIVITVEDDGKGMDPEVIKRKAVEKGLISAEQAARMDGQDALELIFLPGFSTADRVTDISGRGVGMDIVRARLEKINGTLDIKSVPGEGTCFTIRLPLTLAINRALLFMLSDQIYAIPLVNVMEIIEIEPARVKKARGREVVMLRGKVLPLLRLDEVLEMRRDVQRDQKQQLVAVVVGFAEKRVGLIVDSLVGEQEIVIKSLGDYLGKIPELAGATLLGDGRICLILDVRGLIENLAREESFDIGV